MKKFLILLSILFCGLAHAATETIDWYVNGVLYDTTTCQSGGDIILPTAPTRTGYTFSGWRYETYDLSTLNTATDGDVGYGYGETGGLCRYTINSSYNTLSCSDSNYSDLSAGEWKVKFSYGTVYGTSKCSITAGTLGQTGNPVDTAGNQCWCRTTKFVPFGEDMAYSAVSLWVFDYSNPYTNPADGCTKDCAGHCSYKVKLFSEMRAGLFGSQVN